MIKLKDLLMEIDDDQMIKYKDEDGESKEMKAGSAKTMGKDHPAKIEYEKQKDGGGDTKKGVNIFDKPADEPKDQPKDKPAGDDLDKQIKDTEASFNMYRTSPDPQYQAMAQGEYDKLKKLKAKRDGSEDDNPIGDPGDVPIGQLPDPSTRQGVTKDEPKDEPDSREKRIAKAKELSKKPLADKDFDALNKARRELDNVELEPDYGSQSKQQDLQRKVLDAESRIEDRRDAVINGEVEATPEEAQATVADMKYKLKNPETWLNVSDKEGSAAEYNKLKKDLKLYQKKVKHMKKGFFGDKYEIFTTKRSFRSIQEDWIKNNL